MSDDFHTRAVNRMHETGIIDAAARDRLLADPLPEDPHIQLGIFQALLSVAIWRDSDEPAPRPACIDNSPPWFTGRWRDWHRGHGCDKDDGKPRTPEGAAEIEAGDLRKARR
jgi:hypothetical protein